ncbi:MAG TPA: aminoacyl-tRNA hydrolase [Candidatus Jacksonbacteria bacterium]|nr:MAG: Peptidyl-tRNA hydrolase [Parcubacteria group bacterium GW2011_GWA2_45_30]HCE86321.1 aminoacyl-tRNA hydrolase [Candidatus Jacksonbacteria bacterium]
MILIVGLGNPGDKFLGTRHNIGRETAQSAGKKIYFPEFKFEKKWNTQISERKFEKTKTILLLPDTFMNKSGNAVGPIAKFYKIKSQDIIILHDDADIMLGRAKLSFGKHSAGHKGVESVKRALGTLDFWRLRIGIQKKKRVEAKKLVLQKLKPDEQKQIKKLEKKIMEGLEMFAAGEQEKAVGIINKNI